MRQDTWKTNGHHHQINHCKKRYLKDHEQHCSCIKSLVVVLAIWGRNKWLIVGSP